MATLVLQAVGAAIGTTLGGPIGGLIGSSIGAVAGSAIDSAAIGAITGPQRFEGPRLARMPGLGASEGAPIPRVYGVARVGGQLIWATRFEEEVSTRRQSGGKGFGRSARITSYAYFANLAVGLCEGEIGMVRRVWADGRLLDLTRVTMRVHHGREDQTPDPLIVAKEGASDAPAYRGTAYVVFERLPLEEYGNRIPQLAFEVVRPVDGFAAAIKGVNLIPGAGEFAYATDEVTWISAPGRSASANRHQLTHATDIAASLEALDALCPNLTSVTLIVAWFGDDLRCAQCTLKPRVEAAVKATHGATWRVAGLDRAAAVVVSQDAGAPAYGGTPSDASVMQAIAAIKARGWRVTLHPFVMMDVPAGNTLNDPWTGVASQPAYPWRGHITVDPAPGRPGTPDASAAATVQVLTFIGAATPAQFSVVAGEVAYTGPAEWSLRRLLLHYAKLATLAGGVDGFLLGSEFRALSTARNAATAYPFADALALVAADVRGMLGPVTTLSYGADWTEYGAHAPVAGEVGFPLDALWAHAAIDAVGIDWYPPLTDWRDGEAHLDAALYAGPNDPAYAAARVAAGEAFDWYYANAADRLAQIRTPISDGAYNKPWLYRPKDLIGWWSNAHIRRVGGVETSATGWVPQSKPIHLLELGCPAVDRGANGPNVFPDVKSAEGGLPPFSRGFRDDLAPRRLIEATLARFDPALGATTADNPISTLYGGRMLDPARIHLWAWDARPYPAFPDLVEAWTDAPNYETGHWFGGRVEAASLGGLLEAIFADHGLTAPVAAGLDALVEGYVIDRPMSARAAVEPLARLYGFDLVAAADGLRAETRNRRALTVIAAEEFIADGDRPYLEKRRAQDTELAAELAVGFTDLQNEFRGASVTARRAGGAGKRLAMQDTALVGRRAEMARLADIRLRDNAAGAETAEFGLAPARLALEPGDVVALPIGTQLRNYEILRIVDAQSRRIEARAIDRSIFEAPPPVYARQKSKAPEIPGVPEVMLLDLPLARGEPAELQHLAVFADPWPGGMVVWRSTDGQSYEPFAQVPFAATMGELIDPLPAGPTSRWDRAANPRVKLFGHTLAAVSDGQGLAGANSFAIKTPSGAIEIITAVLAELVGEQTYRLTRLLRGLGASEAVAASAAPVGSRLVALNAAIVALSNDAADLGRVWRYRIAPVGLDHADPRAVAIEAAPGSAALRPFSPVRARAVRQAGGIQLDWIRRSRIGGDSWEAVEIPIGEARERYEVDIRDLGGALKRTLTSTTTVVLYTSADEIVDFGAPVANLSVAIAQMSDLVGRGHAHTAILPVT